MKKTAEESSQKLLSILFPIFSTIFILAVALGMYYFSKGYRINISEREITKTGVLAVKTDPLLASTFINDENTGRTPNSKALSVGEYNVSVRKENYLDWNKRVQVVEEKSTVLTPWMVLKENTKNEIWKSSNKLEKYWIDQKNETLIYLIKDSESQYTLWRYKINTPLWDFNTNPIEILTLQSKDIELTVSPKGNQVLLKILTEKTPLYILDTSKKNDLKTVSTFDNTDYLKYTITWANDNRHLILESTKEILSYDTIRQTVYTLTEKVANQKYPWATDEEGFFYITTPTGELYETTYVYSLIQYRLDGTNPKQIIDKIYMRKDSSYIEHYRESTIPTQEFTNSIEDTQTAGQIEEIAVNQSAKGVYIKTEQATYWYYIDSQKYIMISPYPIEILEISEDLKKMLLKDDENIMLLTFTKDEADLTEKIGTEIIQDLENVDKAYWISNSLNIYYIKDNQFYISDKNGENKYSILKTENIKSATINSSRDHIVTLETDSEETTYINEYKIH
ncbi:MAG: PEGA domain-containing protein [Candidatus Dojkabacteria bacterium]